MVFPRDSRRVSAFLWDADGTIVDSREFAFDATNDALKRLGKRTYTSNEFLELFSSDYMIHIERMGINSARELSLLVDTWNTKLVTDKGKFKLYDGVLGTLSYLRGRSYKMALVSSTSRTQIQLYFNMFGIDRFFSVVIAREDVDEQKPSIKPIFQAAEQLGVAPSNCVLIDDMEDGIRAARKLGVTTIGVTWGFNSRRRIVSAKPDYIAETPNELHKIIQKLACQGSASRFISQEFKSSSYSWVLTRQIF